MNYQQHSNALNPSKRLQMVKGILQQNDKKSSLKMFGKLNGQQIEEQNQHNQETITKPFALSKIKITFDQQQTKKIGWQKGFSNLNNSHNKQLKDKNAAIFKITNDAAAPKQALQIPYNKKVQQIMSKKPLRQRLSIHLPPQIQLPISYDHQQIIKRMQLIDRTIQFLDSHRNMKVMFFQTIKKNIFESSSILIEMKLIQQLLFLDENCYNVQWLMNQKVRRHDIKISLPRIQSMDLRKTQLRAKIVKYLIYKEGQFLAQKGLTKVDNHKWHELFQYQKVTIPTKSLPVHPNFSNSDIRAFANQQIQKVDNPILKSLFKKKKQKSQIKSLSSASVADMIFSKVSANEITNQILSSIRQKQKINNEGIQKQKIQGQKIDKQAILKIFDEILLIFMSKNVTNIFKVTLIQLLNQRLKLKDILISKYLQKLLNLQGLNCLKVIQSSKKVQVIQIDKQKYKQGRNLVGNSF